jgi:sarcosine oxidase gamma subunit
MEYNLGKAILRAKERIQEDGEMRYIWWSPDGWTITKREPTLVMDYIEAGASKVVSIHVNPKTGKKVENH